MKPESTFLWVVRISWPLLGGVWGAVVGFGGYHRITHNADSFGMFFAHGFFITTAIIRLFVGITSSIIVGGLTEKLLRYLGAWVVVAVCVATMVNALALWQLVGLFQNKYPVFRSPVIKPLADTPQAPSTRKIQPDNFCAQPPPPENSKARVNWDAECR